MPRVSVIIPAYNCAPYIQVAVKSVLAQTFRDFELIVIDDGSTDDTLECLAPFGNDVQIIRQENRGVAAARNRGLKAATGEHIAFLDADDWWMPVRLRAQLEALERFPQAGLVFSDFNVQDTSGASPLINGIRWKYRSVRRASAAPWSRIFSESASLSGGAGLENMTAYGGWIGSTLFHGNFILTSSVLVRADAIRGVGGFDETLDTEEDYDCFLKLSQGWPFVYIDSPLLSHRRRPGQLTRPEQIERVTRNAMRVVQAAAERMNHTIRPADVRARMAVLHRDVGVICLRNRRRPEARHHLMKSLRQRPRQLVVLALLAVALLPWDVIGLVNEARRRFSWKGVSRTKVSDA